MAKTHKKPSSKQLWFMTLAGLLILILAITVSFLSFINTPFKDRLQRSNPAPVALPTLGETGDTCRSALTGQIMDLPTARDLAVAGECGQAGKLKGTSSCNQSTGTWWLDLDIDKEGCSPACVVNVTTGETEVNWRCTGILLEDISLSPAPLATRSSGCGCGQ